MKLAVVVQRYGADINGGAELHARYIAEHLSPHVDLEVLTTCARDYVTWRNELAPGESRVNDVAVRRFPVDHERDPAVFGRRSRRVFEEVHALADELSWLEAEGPSSAALIRYIRTRRPVFDYFLFFSYRYYHAYHGFRVCPDRAVLVPTAERDAAVGLGIFGPVFRGVRALMYNTHEEQAMINAVAGNENVPGLVVGVGSEVPEEFQPQRFRSEYGISGPFAIYVGRIDENKGCKDLFDFYLRYLRISRNAPTLILIGEAVHPVPLHPRIRHLGCLADRDKFDAIAASDLLIMPSLYESLSMVALEAWAAGTPVLANGRCDVLKGQCIRSNAGLYYENFQEFAEALSCLQSNRPLNRALGANGRAFFRSNYTWPVIEGKYLAMLDRLTREPPRPIEPRPGWFARRRRNLRPAIEVVTGIPAGPVLTESIVSVAR